MTSRHAKRRVHACACMQGGTCRRLACSRVGRLALLVLVLLVLGTGCDVAETKAETAKIEAEADRLAAQGNADAARIQAEGDAQAAVIAAEAQAMEAEAAANEAKAATTEALAILEQAQGDRTVKEAVANQVDGITGVLEATTGTLRMLAFGVVALVVVFSVGVVGILALAWRGQQQAAQVPGPQYVLVELPEQKAIGRDEVPALLRPISRSEVRRG